MTFCDTTAGIGPSFRTHGRNHGRTEPRTHGWTDKRGSRNSYLDTLDYVQANNKTKETLHSGIQYFLLGTCYYNFETDSTIISRLEKGKYQKSRF